MKKLVKKVVLVLAIILVAVALTACPGSSTKPSELEKVLLSEKALDGYIIKRGTGEVHSDIEYITVGDFSQNQHLRGFVSFDLASLPSNAKIIKAELALYQREGVEVVSNRPYQSLGDLLLGHISFGSSLDGDDLDRDLLTSDTVVLSKDASIGWKKVDVSNWVQNDIDNSLQRSSKSQYRIQFTKQTDNDRNSDTIWLVSGDEDKPERMAFRPILKITYTTP